jgi:hypothetical protein
VRTLDDSGVLALGIHRSHGASVGVGWPSGGLFVADEPDTLEHPGKGGLAGGPGYVARRG